MNPIGNGAWYCRPRSCAQQDLVYSVERVGDGEQDAAALERHHRSSLPALVPRIIGIANSSFCQVASRYRC